MCYVCTIKGNSKEQDWLWVASRRVNMICIRLRSRKPGHMEESNMVRDVEIKLNMMCEKYELFFPKTIVGNSYYILLYTLEYRFLCGFFKYSCFLLLSLSDTDVVGFTFGKFAIWYLLNCSQESNIYIGVFNICDSDRICINTIPFFPKN